MYYIEKTEHGILVVNENTSKMLKTGMVKYLNSLMVEHHVTLKGRIEALRTKYNLHKNIPIYLNEKCCFYTTKPLRATDTICINYHKVLSIRETDHNTTEIIFKNLHILHVPLPYQTLVRKHLKAQRCIHQIEKTG